MEAPVGVDMGIDARQTLARYCPKPPEGAGTTAFATSYRLSLETKCCNSKLQSRPHLARSLDSHDLS